jgi:2,3-bisphosphoglycerate-dependent phosphoglycerate mutase
MSRHGYSFDIAYTAPLKRSTLTLDLALKAMKHPPLPIQTDWRLNERHYGALQGLNKQETREKYGAEQFQRWRRGYRERPPALATDDPRAPRNDPRYAHMDAKLLPLTESLEDTYHRAVAYWNEEIAPKVRDGKGVIIASHGNTLRALAKHLDNMSDAEIEAFEIPTGRPLVYELNDQLGVLRRYYLDELPVSGKQAAAH